MDKADRTPPFSQPATSVLGMQLPDWTYRFDDSSDFTDRPRLTARRMNNKRPRTNCGTSVTASVQNGPVAASQIADQAAMGSHSNSSDRVSGQLLSQPQQASESQRIQNGCHTIGVTNPVNMSNGECSTSDHSRQSRAGTSTLKGATCTNGDVVSENWLGWPSESESDSETDTTDISDKADTATSALTGTERDSKSTKGWKNGIRDIINNDGEPARRDKNVFSLVSASAGACADKQHHSGNKAGPSKPSQSGSINSRRFGTPQIIWDRFSARSDRFEKGSDTCTREGLQPVGQRNIDDNGSVDFRHTESGTIENGQTTENPGHDESSYCVILGATPKSVSSAENRSPPRDSPLRPENWMKLEDILAGGRSAGSEHNIERTRGNPTDTDESWLSAQDLEEDAVQHAVADDSVQLIDASSSCAFDDSEVQRLAMQSFYGSPHRSAASSGTYESVSNPWNHSFSDFVAADDDVLYVSSSSQHQTPDARRASNSASPDLELLHVEGTGASGGSGGASGVTQVPGMPAMTDEEYARFLQEQIDVEESYRIQAAERREANYRPYPRGRNNPVDIDPVMLQQMGVHLFQDFHDDHHGRRGRRHFGLPHRFFREQGFRRQPRHYGFATYEYDADSSVDDYEENLRLQEQLGDAVSQAMPHDLVMQLPTHTYTEAEVAAGKECNICMCQYEKGDTERVLPCFHTFHVKCIDRWFEMQSTCPVCRESAKPRQTP